MINPIAMRLVMAGRVQAVGFRPFVYRLALRESLGGYVRNQVGQVEIVIAGDEPAINRFCAALVSEAPPLAEPLIAARDVYTGSVGAAFEILESSADGPAEVSLPPDFFACADCLRELVDPGDRRHGYPFVSCTQCGPRYTAIDALPFDRRQTTMADFEFCALCAQEYASAADRRYHAEISACPNCGPTLTFSSGVGRDVSDSEAALAAAVQLLCNGGILAAKGVGGYHLLCDATNHDSISMLRTRKQRPARPVAVLFPWRGEDGLAAVRREVVVCELTAAQLIHPERPIVLAPKRDSVQLAHGVAPGLNEVGVFLPYTPLLHLLTDAVDLPLVATSGNISGEPIVTSTKVASARLKSIADGFLHHDRRISRPADDSVRRVIAGKARPMRLGRGAAPLELHSPVRISQPTLALGGHLKNTLALGWGERIVVFPHIGDMENAASLDLLEALVRELPELYGVNVSRLVCDAHPGYATSRWARRQPLKLTTVHHHHAHASALAAEHDRVEEKLLVFTWDGVGLGEDGALWGGECFLGRPGHWRRVVSFLPFPLVGGERAAREPWRVAAALCALAGIEYALPERLNKDQRRLFRHALAGSPPSPSTSAVGRLFDGAAALVTGMEATSYEAQAAMTLEALCGDHDGACAPLPLIDQPAQPSLVDWRPLVALLVDAAQPQRQRAALFHGALAATIAAIAARHPEVRHVGLCGGVFQNRRLSEAASELLGEMGLNVLLCERLPCNDGGLSFGQLMEGAAHDR